MKQSRFEAQHQALWIEIDALTASPSKGDPRRLPTLYRRLCQTLALARQRGYSPSLTAYLESLAQRSHARFYHTPVERPALLRQWLVRDIPQLVRAEWKLGLLAFLAFWAVAIACGVMVWHNPEWAYGWVSPEQLAEYQAMYQPGALKAGRGGSEGDLYMFCFYIWNNVSISFRTFASGLFGGIPAILSLLFNGLHGGIVAGWLSRDPATREVFWSFVVTHSSFEITGLILAGQAGMRMGLALINPGRLTRRMALQQAGERMFPVLVGAALMTFIAAFFEAFWSASPLISPTVKYLVGGGCWTAVLAYLLLAGRGRHAA